MIILKCENFDLRDSDSYCCYTIATTRSHCDMCCQASAHFILCSSTNQSILTIMSVFLGTNLSLSWYDVALQ